MLADSGGHPSSPVTASEVAAPAPENVEAMGTDQLLAEARKAMNEQRYLAPAGNNAFEFYLKALEREPGNPVATDALRETFPFAASAAEQAINARNFNETRSASSWTRSSRMRWTSSASSSWLRRRRPKRRRRRRRPHRSRRLRPRH
jgi:hypothetical protein